ncbi:MAG: 50S ribosomal protein L21 [bacterium]
MNAVIRIGGKQLVVTEGQTFYAELQVQEPGSSFSAPEVLAVFDDTTTTIGTPLVDGATVTLKCLRHGKARKTKSIRYKRRKAVHKITGHRQPYSWLMVESIA